MSKIKKNLHHFNEGRHIYKNEYRKELLGRRGDSSHPTSFWNYPSSSFFVNSNSTSHAPTRSKGLKHPTLGSFNHFLLIKMSQLKWSICNLHFLNVVRTPAIKNIHSISIWLIWIPRIYCANIAKVGNLCFSSHHQNNTLLQLSTSTLYHQNMSSSYATSSPSTFKLSPLVWNKFSFSKLECHIWIFSSHTKGINILKPWINKGGNNYSSYWAIMLFRTSHQSQTLKPWIQH